MVDARTLRECAPRPGTDVYKVKIELVSATVPVMQFGGERCFQRKYEAHEAGKRDGREREANAWNR